MSYGLRLSNPREFFAESHRPSHFLEFSKLEVSREGQLLELEIFCAASTCELAVMRCYCAQMRLTDSQQSRH